MNFTIITLWMKIYVASMKYYGELWETDKQNGLKNHLKN